MLVSAPQAAHADFIDAYVIEQGDGRKYSLPPDGAYGTWTLATIGDKARFGARYLDTRAAPGSVTMDPGSPDTSSITQPLRLVLSNTAAASGTLSFSYNLMTGYDHTTSYEPDTYLEREPTAPNSTNKAGYFVNETFHYFPLGNGSARVEGIALVEGDLFGFFAEAGQKSISQDITSFAQLTISDFSAPVEAVPEPSTWMFCGLGLLVGFVRIRQLRKGQS